MRQISIPAVPIGSILDIWCLGYWHRVISGPVGPNGKPSLISASSRWGTVMEEPWDVVVQGREVRLVRAPDSWPAGAEIVDKARGFIGVWKYNLFTRNCEHFVSTVLDGRPSSPQLAKLGVAALGVFGAGLAISRIRQA
ncbi:lecithin retinol acyltransferase family protein [Pseudoalteromonas sp. GABNS16A]|uniref:lecithin retinol acyltransferase family protein n=1 Tax=unclassified Pseudoalteromonas TaxID=194690 RepID=UPI0034DE6693